MIIVTNAAGMIDGIAVKYDTAIIPEQIKAIVQEEKEIWKEKKKELAYIEIGIDDGEIVVRTVEKSPIRRIRRITGYCVCLDNWNEAKQDELKARYKHM